MAERPSRYKKKETQISMMDALYASENKENLYKQELKELDRAIDFYRRVVLEDEYMSNILETLARYTHLLGGRSHDTLSGGVITFEEGYNRLEVLKTLQKKIRGMLDLEGMPPQHNSTLYTMVKFLRREIYYLD